MKLTKYEVRWTEGYHGDMEPGEDMSRTFVSFIPSAAREAAIQFYLELREKHFLLLTDTFFERVVEITEKEIT